MVQTSIFGGEYDTKKVISSLPKDLREIESWKKGSEFLLYKGNAILDDSFDFYKSLLLVSLMNMDWLKGIIESKLGKEFLGKNQKFSFFIKTPEKSKVNKENIDDRRVHVSDLGITVFDRLSQDSDFIIQLNNFIEDPIYSNDWCFMLPKRVEPHKESKTSMADFPLKVHVVLNANIF